MDMFMEDMMPDPSPATYPFTSGAAAYVRELGVDIPDLLEKRVYNRARARGAERVIQAIEGRIETNARTDMPAELEVLSYPIARMIVSCIGDDFLIRRYALAEAKAAYESLMYEQRSVLATMGQEFGMNVDISEQRFRLHFTDYVRYAHRMHDPGWKLVNRQLQSGWLSISEREFTRLLQEAIRDRIQQDLPLEIPSGIGICDKLSRHIAAVKESLGARKTEFEIRGKVNPDAFPPCIARSIAMLQGGVNLAHSARFATTAFLRNIGMSVDEIVGMFGGSPDFDETRTRYQVEHIAGHEYTAPGCDTMKTYGNCVGADDLCGRIAHPLNYYRIKKKARGSGETAGAAQTSVRQTG
jgi:DNA primase large subunit